MCKNSVTHGHGILAKTLFTTFTKPLSINNLYTQKRNTLFCPFTSRRNRLLPTPAILFVYGNGSYFIRQPPLPQPQGNMFIRI